MRTCENLTWIIHKIDLKHNKKHWYTVADHTNSIITSQIIAWVCTGLEGIESTAVCCLLHFLLIRHYVFLIKCNTIFSPFPTVVEKFPCAIHLAKQHKDLVPISLYMFWRDNRGREEGEIVFPLS